MQSDDSCKDTTVTLKSISSNEVTGDQTLVQEMGSGVDNKSEGNNGDLSQRRDTTSFEGTRDSGIHFVSNEGEEGSEKSGEIKAATSPCKTNSDSAAKCLFQKSVSDDDNSKVEPEKTVDEVKKSTIELIKQAAMSKKEEINVDEEGVYEDLKGVDPAVGFDECVRDEGQDGEKKVEFCDSDLVWGKVRSHPWWPGQIINPGDASDKARKYSKSNAYLVGYFWDRTFGWNVEANLKPFVPNFSEMVKQTNKESFRRALDCVLGEITRRVEFGLSCGCIADDVYNQLKSQVIENVGIRKQSRIREGGDRFLTASSFEPLKFLDYVRDLALGPRTDVDKLEHAIVQAQTTAFYRWKGIYHLAHFGPLIGYINNEADAPVTAEKEIHEVINEETPPPNIMEEDATRPQKRKKVSVSGDSGSPSKKVKRVSDRIVKNCVSKKGDEVSERKSGSKPISSSGKIQKEAKLFGSDSKTKSGSKANSYSGKKEKVKLFGSHSKMKESCPAEPTAQVKNQKSSFRIGERFLRIAGQLNQRSPLLKTDEPSSGKSKKDKGNSKLYGTHNTKHVSLDVIVSELRLTAIKPLKEHNLLSNMVTFFSGFRNSIIPDNELLQKHEDSKEDATGYPEERPPELTAYVCSTGTGGGNSKAKISESELPIISDLYAIEDALSTNKTISGSVIGASLGATLKVKTQQEDSPTALILKFSDVDSIPPEAKLNNIFSHFGPLKESETEVLAKKSCARVVFKRKSDAETAFSSSGKFKTFGPSLVCYQLNYSPSPRKLSSDEAKGKKGVESH